MANWKHTINIKQHLSNDISREGIVKAAKGIISELEKLNEYDFSGFSLYDIKCGFSDIVDIHTEYEDYSTLDEFNGWLEELYDWADYHRVWVGL